MEEIWKDIKGYEGLYQVSNLGNVKSLSRVSIQGHILPTKILKFGYNLQGYKIVGLHRDGSSKTRTVHRLVAEAFIPNSNNYPCINHIDENKQNNRVDNLEWCTYEYNNNYGTSTDRMRKSLTGRHLSECTKQKISKSSKGRKHTDKTKLKISHSNMGKHLYLKEYNMLRHTNGRYDL